MSELTIKVVNTLLYNKPIPLPVNLVINPDKGENVCGEDFIGIVDKVVGSNDGEVFCSVMLYEPHRYLQQGQFEFKYFDDVLHVVQIEVIETYKPGMDSGVHPADD